MAPDDFKLELERLNLPNRLAVAVSGGADSIALAYALSNWADKDLHILCVDHGLREEAASEALFVSQFAESIGAQFQALKWEHDGVSSRVQEEARRARYSLMAEYCAGHNLTHLCLGHHMDDQVETVLFRLARGSGLDGLLGMKSISDYSTNLKLVRPFLSFEKAELAHLCNEYGLDYIDDPSNLDEKYARVRIRTLREGLEKEGLSTKRLGVTIKRLSRAQEALEVMADNLYENAVLERNSGRVVFDFLSFASNPYELFVRCIFRVFRGMVGEGAYQPRMERVEELCSELLDLDNAFRKRTLGGLIFSRNDKSGEIIIECEAEHRARNG